jgi:RNA recognition motif-containing protein
VFASKPKRQGDGSSKTKRQDGALAVPERKRAKHEPALPAAPSPPAAKPATSRPAVDPAEEAERLSRTVYVGNLPPKTNRKDLKRHFSTFGQVESVRLRAAAAANPKMSNRAAVITGDIAGESISGYVVFTAGSSAVAATGASGALAFGRHLRVDAAVKPGESSAAASRHDSSKSVFVGNLPFDVSEEAVWSAFEACGKVSYVRLIREPRTRVGKGFGYVGFNDAGSVESALGLHGTSIACMGETADGAPAAPRKMRVFRCSTGKSHARLTQLQKVGGNDERGSTSGPTKGATLKEDAAPHMGWMDRQRRRLGKKLAKRAEAAKNKAGKGIAKSLGKLQAAIGKSKSGLSAKARGEAKARAIAKRERSKLALGKRSALGRAKGNDKRGGKKGGSAKR